MNLGNLPERVAAAINQNTQHLVCGKSELEIREKIAKLEAALRDIGGEENAEDLPLKHTFTDGIYSREIFIPKGMTVVGKIHRHEHLNFISIGDVTVLTKDGLKRLRGPCTMVSSAGTKRALYTHEDTVWTTIHANPTNETDIGKIEDFTIAKDYALLENKQQQIEVDT